MIDRLARLALRLQIRATRDDGWLDRRFVAFVFVAAYAVFVVTYLAINEFSAGRDASILYLPGEDRIPLVPELEFIYASGYVLPAVALFKLPDAGRFVRLLFAFAFTLAGAYMTYLLFPVYLERPELTVDSLPTLMLSLEYLDHSYNHLPSLHVAISWLVYLACRATVRRPGILLIWVLSVASSTLFVKQHYLVDVAAGLLFASAAWWIAGKIMSQTPGT